MTSAPTSSPARPTARVRDELLGVLDDRAVRAAHRLRRAALGAPGRHGVDQHLELVGHQRVEADEVLFGERLVAVGLERDRRRELVPVRVEQLHGSPTSRRRSCRGHAGRSPRRCRTGAGRPGSGSGPDALASSVCLPSRLSTTSVSFSCEVATSQRAPFVFWHSSARPWRPSIRSADRATYWPTSSTMNTRRFLPGRRRASISNARSANHLAVISGAPAAFDQESADG